METNQKNYRKEHLLLRNTMTTEEVQQKSCAIVKKLLDSDWYKGAEEIFLYYPLGTEVDCKTLMMQAVHDGKKLALPRTASDFCMDFYYIKSFGQLAEGAFHVMEPKEECKKAVPCEQIVLTPGVVFGRDGSRYGYGKGYYDRFFARYPKLKKYGICYENQLEQTLFTDVYDVKMERIYTESQVIEITGKDSHYGIIGDL